jgi:hypothetical protein
LIDALYPTSGTRKKEGADAILDSLKAHGEEASLIKAYVDARIGSVAYNQDKLLILDLCRLAVDRTRFSKELIGACGQTSLAEYRALSQETALLSQMLQKEMRKLYRETEFKTWRQTHFKAYLKGKREEEKKNRTYARPYTDYLDRMEKKMFKEFWQAHRWALLHTLIVGAPLESTPHTPYLLALHDHLLKENAPLQHLHAVFQSVSFPLSLEWLKSIRSFDDLTRPLYGKYRMLRHKEGVHLEKHLASAFYPLSGYNYGRSQAYRQLAPQGSVFKLVTSYQALLERYQRGEMTLNPLTITDDLHGDKRSSSDHQILGYFLDGQPITRAYKGGLLPRSSPHVGRIDLVGALEQSSNLYFSLLASDHFHDPAALGTAARQFGYGEKTGIDLPLEPSGSVPHDLSYNRTGLYSFAIGQHAFVTTPLQSAMMMAALANGGEVLKPKIIQLIAGKELADEEELVLASSSFPYKEELSLVGIHFPLFTEAVKELEYLSIVAPPTEVKRSLALPDPVKDIIFQGMQQVVLGPKGSARPAVLRSLYEFPHSVRDYIALQHQMIAKTGTAELLYKQTIDAETAARKENHVWFAALSFPQEPHQAYGKTEWPEPDLVVVIYLRFGRAGKDGALLAAQIVKKWREICDKHRCLESFSKI